MNIWRHGVAADITLLAEFPSSARDRETVSATCDRETVGSTCDHEFVSRTWAREAVSSTEVRHIGKIRDHGRCHRAFARTEE
jgi:hypothetical protein